MKRSAVLANLQSRPNNERNHLVSGNLEHAHFLLSVCVSNSGRTHSPVGGGGRESGSFGRQPYPDGSFFEFQGHGYDVLPDGRLRPPPGEFAELPGGWRLGCRPAERIWSG